MTKSKSTSRAEALRRALADKSEPAELEMAEHRPLKVIGYVRVSTTVQDTKGYGLRSQQEYLTKYCHDRGISCSLLQAMW